MSWRLGQLLGVQNMQTLESTGDGVGFGTVGDLENPMAVEEFEDIIFNRKEPSEQ